MQLDAKDEADAADAARATFEVERIERNPWVIGAAAVPLMLLPLLWVTALVTWQAAFLLPTFHLGVLGTVLTVWAWRRNPWPRCKKVKVRVEEDAVVVGDERVERAGLTRGVAVPRASGVEVHLARKGPDVELAVGSPEEARRMLEALGFDARQTVAAFRTMSPMHRSTIRTVAAVLATLGLTGAAAAVLALLSPAVAGGAMLVGLATMMTLLFAPSRIEVGADGVLVKWLGRDRFISHGDIAGTRLQVTGMGRNKVQHVVLELRDGKELRIPISHPRWDDGRAGALLTRIREAGEVHRSGGAEEEALLLRGDRPHRSWVAVLRSGGLATLRTAALSRDKLWRVIEDASAGALERAAAAVALGKDLGAEERQRLERAARATAAPKLRVVLETAADAEDEQLAERLEELEEPVKKKRAGG